MSKAIVIRLVAVRGKLVGLTASDRWNVASLFGNAVIFDDRNGAGIKQARRRLARLGMADDFVLQKVRTNAPPIWSATRREAEALGPALAIVCPEFDAVAVYGG